MWRGVHDPLGGNLCAAQTREERCQYVSGRSRHEWTLRLQHLPFLRSHGDIETPSHRFPIVIQHFVAADKMSEHDMDGHDVRIGMANSWQQREWWSNSDSGTHRTEANAARIFRIKGDDRSQHTHNRLWLCSCPLIHDTTAKNDIHYSLACVQQLPRPGMELTKSWNSILG